MRRGFFNTEQTKMASRSGKHSLSCAACGLYKDCRTPRMDPYGENQRNILVIGEAPGETEDRQGKPFVGKTGQLLQKTFAEQGIDLFRDCLVLNAVNCRPQDNDTPTDHQIDCCRVVKVNKTLKEYNPRAIVLVGNIALRSFLGGRWKRDLHGINTWRGMRFPDQEYGAWVFPIWHPSYVERRDRDREFMTIWNQDIENIRTHYNDDLPKHKKPKIEIIEDLTLLDEIQSGMVSIDFETTGLKPHAPGHRIVSASVSPDKDTAYAFLMPKTRKKRRPFLNLLTNNQVTKMAHNMKFEQAWSMYRLGVEINNLGFDSMLAAHLLDNRPNITSLAFQAYLYLGIMEYDQEVGQYLKSVESKNGNSHNRLEEFIEAGGERPTLIYNGMDTIVQYRIAVEQIKIMNYDFLPF